MAAKKVYECDQCKAQKKDTNHWLLAFVNNKQEIKFMPWNNDFFDSHDVKHLCGEQCATKELNQWLADRLA